MNVQHIQIVDNGKPLPEEQNFVPVSYFEFSISYFTYLLTVSIKSTSSSPYPTFVFTFQDIDLLQRAFLNTNKPKYTSSKIFLTLNLPTTS